MSVDAIKWLASISGMIAAIMVASDLGRRIIGWGFVIFTGSSLCWIAAGLIDAEKALSTQNIVLFAINLLGVYRYLLSPERKQKAEA